jgi:hypothetical protein
MDPRNVSVQNRPDDRSRLMSAKGKAASGEKPNFCPHGCTDEELDDNGYCRHLIGFTTDGKIMEPMVTDARGRRYVDGSKSSAVPPGSTLERITTCHRVYHRGLDKDTKK